MVTDEQLNAVYDWAFASAERLVAEGRQCEPVVLSCRFINGKMRRAKVMGFTDFSTEEHKDRVAGVMKELITRPQIDVVCFVCESWYVGAFKDPTLADRTAAAQLIRDQSLPSQHPERKEGVIFNLYTKLFDCMALCHIERPRLVRSELIFTTGAAVGRFVRTPQL